MRAARTLSLRFEVPVRTHLILPEPSERALDNIGTLDESPTEKVREFRELSMLSGVLPDVSAGSLDESFIVVVLP